MLVWIQVDVDWGWGFSVPAATIAVAVHKDVHESKARWIKGIEEEE